MMRSWLRGHQRPLVVVVEKNWARWITQLEAGGVSNLQIFLIEEIR